MTGPVTTYKDQGHCYYYYLNWAIFIGGTFWIVRDLGIYVFDGNAQETLRPKYMT